MTAAAPGPAVSVVVPSWNARDALERCLRAVEAARGEVEGLQLIVVDDASDDGSAALVEREFPRAELIRCARNGGFTRATNLGLERAAGELVLLLNADCELRPAALGRLVEFLRGNDEYAAAAPRLLDAEGDAQRACMGLPGPWTALWHGTPLERWRPEGRELERYFARDFDHAHDADVEQPPAACLLVRRAVLRELGGLDERMTLYFSDVDLSQRLLDAGWRTRFLASAEAVHLVGLSTSQRSDRLVTWHRDRLAYYRVHHGRAAGVLVKGCVMLTAADHVLRGQARPGPVLRQVAAFLAS